MQSWWPTTALWREYGKACRDELKYGCTFATLSGDNAIGCSIRFHSPATAAALWSGEKGRIDCGLAIVDTVKDEHFEGVMAAFTLVQFLHRRHGPHRAARQRQLLDGGDANPHPMGRPLMEPLIWNATNSKPFGRCRLKAPHPRSDRRLRPHGSQRHHRTGICHHARRSTSSA